MQKLLAVYNTFDEATYHAVLTAGRPDQLKEEKEELAGYKRLHGACKGYAPLGLRASAHDAPDFDLPPGTATLSQPLLPARQASSRS